MGPALYSTRPSIAEGCRRRGDIKCSGLSRMKRWVASLQLNSLRWFELIDTFLAENELGLLIAHAHLVSSPFAPVAIRFSVCRGRLASRCSLSSWHDPIFHSNLKTLKEIFLFSQACKENKHGRPSSLLYDQRSSSRPTSLSGLSNRDSPCTPPPFRRTLIRRPIIQR